MPKAMKIPGYARGGTVEGTTANDSTMQQKLTMAPAVKYANPGEAYTWGSWARRPWADPMRQPMWERDSSGYGPHGNYRLSENWIRQMHPTYNTMLKDLARYGYDLKPHEQRRLDAIRKSQAENKKKREAEMAWERTPGATDAMNVFQAGQLGAANQLIGTKAWGTAEDPTARPEGWVAPPTSQPEGWWNPDGPSDTYTNTGALSAFAERHGKDVSELSPVTVEKFTKPHVSTWKSYNKGGTVQGFPPASDMARMHAAPNSAVMGGIPGMRAPMMGQGTAQNPQMVGEEIMGIGAQTGQPHFLMNEGPDGLGGQVVPERLTITPVAGAKAKGKGRRKPFKFGRVADPMRVLAEMRV